MMQSTSNQSHSLTLRLTCSPDPQIQRGTRGKREILVKQKCAGHKGMVTSMRANSVCRGPCSSSPRRTTGSSCPSRTRTRTGEDPSRSTWTGDGPRGISSSDEATLTNEGISVRAGGAQEESVLIRLLMCVHDREVKELWNRYYVQRGAYPLAPAARRSFTMAS